MLAGLAEIDLEIGIGLGAGRGAGVRREDRAGVMELVIRLIQIIPTLGILEAPPRRR
jgi:hypothetical protein